MSMHWSMQKAESGVELSQHRCSRRRYISTTTPIEYTRSWVTPDLVLQFQCSVSSSWSLAVCIPVVVISHPFTPVSVLFSVFFSPPPPFLVSTVLSGIIFLVSVVLSLFRGISFAWIIITYTVFVFVLHLQDMHLRLDQVTHYLKAKRKKGSLSCIQNSVAWRD